MFPVAVPPSRLVQTRQDPCRITLTLTLFYCNNKGHSRAPGADTKLNQLRIESKYRNLLIENSRHHRARKLHLPNLSTFSLEHDLPRSNITLPDNDSLVVLMADCDQVAGFVNGELTGRPAA